MADAPGPEATHQRFLTIGMLAATFAALNTMVQRETLTDNLRLATACFAAAVPVLAYLGVEFTIQDRNRTTPSVWLMVISALAHLLTIVGFVFFVWHLSATAGVVFLVSIGVAFVLICVFSAPPATPPHQ